MNTKKSIKKRLNTKNRSLKQISYCSPRQNNETFTCLTKPSLKRIINSWNDYYKSDQITNTDIDTRQQLWSKINAKLSKVCDNEYCWTKQPFVTNYKQKGSITKEFKPAMPTSWQQNANEWLTTSNIDSVMKQYMRKHKDFMFIGAVPIDFDSKMSPEMCVVDELCKIKIERLLKRGFNKIGIVFNLDPHDQPGSHWVSFFGNIKNGNFYYFDSYGFQAPEQIKTLADRLMNQAKSNNMRFKYRENKKRHQFKDSECGIYSIYFIETMLTNENFNTFCNSKIPDEVMEKFRTKYFIKYKD